MLEVYITSCISVVCEFGPLGDRKQIKETCGTVKKDGLDDASKMSADQRVFFFQSYSKILCPLSQMFLMEGFWGEEGMNSNSFVFLDIHLCITQFFCPREVPECLCCVNI